jgi:hypothetical protein
MTSNLPAPTNAAAVSTVGELHEDHLDPQQQGDIHQDLRVALIPIALVVFITIAFVVAAWTFLATG